jgi:hypothetical protein
MKKSCNSTNPKKRLPSDFSRRFRTFRDFLRRKKQPKHNLNNKQKPKHKPLTPIGAIAKMRAKAQTSKTQNSSQPKHKAKPTTNN